MKFLFFIKYVCVWCLIERLANHLASPDKGSASSELSVHDLQYAVLNNAHAQVLWTAIEYGIWFKSHHAGKCFNTEVGLETVPELQKLLERYLDLLQEHSEVVHSIYGQLLSHLLWLDYNWTAKHIDKIFPTEPKSWHLFMAAWKLFIVSTDPHDKIFALLEQKYVYAVEHMVINDKERWCPGDPNAELVMHILLHYRYGKISLDTTGLLSRIFAKMSDEWRGQALVFVGKTISTTETTPDELYRLQMLWEWRYSECKQGQPEHSHRHELASFGAWWISEKFPDGWAYEYLESVLSIVNWAEPDNDVVEKLAEIAKNKPFQAVYLLSQMCKGLRPRFIYRYFPWVKYAREIITSARDSDDEAARQIALELVSRLRFWDYGGFNDLD